MNGSNIKSISKYLSYLLRHHPEEIGLSIDRQGWASVDELIAKSQQEGRPISRQQINKLISSPGKQRFLLSDDGAFIRAGYGHSIDVELQLDPSEPPGILYHGTARSNVASILREGLVPQSRNYVHLSDNPTDAKSVGSRHGHPVILHIESGRMYRDGTPFYQSDSEPTIWLTERVPTHYIRNEPR